MEPSDSDNKQRQVYTLSQITDSITRMFEKFYQSPYWIMAEISALNLYPVSGHCFPLMVEKSEGKVKAQLKAIIWKDDLFSIARKFEQTTHEPLHEGLNIMFLAYIRFSSAYGLSLQIVDIEPLYTLGEMARDKINSVLELKKEGIFANNKSLTLPVLFKRIAVVSVESSKGYHDLMVTLQNNQQGYKVLSTLFPAVLQGKGAVESITGQLKSIRKLIKQFDAVVIVRGGGDDVGLSCYDHIDLAREVAMFPLPVITGIGHSTNETVVEMVACVNKITPTDVAHFILSGFREQDIRLRDIQQAFALSLAALWKDANDDFSALIEHLNQSIHDYLLDEGQSLAETADSFALLVNSLVFNNRVALSRYETSITHYPYQIINYANNDLLGRGKMMLFNTRHFLSAHDHNLNEKEHRLRLLDPVNVMKRGYAILQVNGKLLVDTSEVKSGDLMEVETYTHRISGTVNEIKAK